MKSRKHHGLEAKSKWQYSGAGVLRGRPPHFKFAAFFCHRSGSAQKCFDSHVERSILVQRVHVAQMVATYRTPCQKTGWSFHDTRTKGAVGRIAYSQRTPVGAGIRCGMEQ